jgi:hypothetical protein
MVGRRYNIKLVTGVQELQRRRPESSTLPAADERLQPVARFRVMARDMPLFGHENLTCGSPNPVVPEDRDREGVTTELAGTPVRVVAQQHQRPACCKQHRRQEGTPT